MISENFVYLGAVISTAFGLSYVIDTLRGKVKPNRVSWFLWFLAPMIAFASQLQQGVRAQALLTFTVGFNPLLVIIASFVSRKAQWKITRFDVLCGAMSVVAIVFWLLAKQPNIAILFSIIADGMAAVPTIIKSYKYPETENAYAFIGGIISAGITLLTINVWNFQNYAFSVYIFVICIVFVSLIKVRPALMRKRAA